MFPALKSIGLKDEEVRRAWAGMCYGAWRTEEFLDAWQTYVMGQDKWQASQYAGYKTKAVDITAYWRPTLKGLKSKHYHDEANKALPAVVFGMVGRVGRVDQIIFGNFFCSYQGFDWQTNLLFVEDGGDCFFQVEYDVSNGAFIAIWVNGES